MTVAGDEDTVEAAAAAFDAALAVCLYTGPGCGAHKRCDNADAAAAWCTEHTAATGHRAEVWPTDIDALAVVNPLAHAMYRYRREIQEQQRLVLTDPDWGKAPVPWRLYEAVRDRVEAGTASADLQTLFPKLVPIYPMEEPPSDRLDPRTQPRPVPRRRRGTKRRR